jgi:hypothetical protein
MRFKSAGNKADNIDFVYKNGEAAATTFVVGQPVVYLLPNTNMLDDGLTVVNPSTMTGFFSSAIAKSLFAGVALEPTAQNQFGFLRAKGAVKALVSNASGSTISTGQILDLDTTNNCFIPITGSPIAGNFSAVLVDSVVTGTTKALVRVFIRTI